MEVGGKPILQYVFDNASQSGAEEVVIATDNDLIAELAASLGAKVVMTSADHCSGTDRIAEAAVINGERPDQIIVNVQADEPLLPPVVIRQVADALLSHPSFDISTVCESLVDIDELSDPNICKLVRSETQRALYFSRAPIPHQRDKTSHQALLKLCRRHVGIYGYRAAFLELFVKLPMSILEETEKLEQLRALANDYTIIALDAKAECGIGIDTPEDLERFRRRIN